MSEQHFLSEHKNKFKKIVEQKCSTISEEEIMRTDILILKQSLKLILDSG